MKNTIIVIVIIVLGIGVYFLLSKNITSPTLIPTAQTQNTTAPASTAQTPVVTPQSQTNISVLIKGFAFSPTSLNIKSGTKVTWTNNDSVIHTVTSDSGSLLNSGNIAPGQSFSFTFTSPGTISYHCAIHPTMKSQVTVTN